MEIPEAFRGLLLRTAEYATRAIWSARLIAERPRHEIERLTAKESADADYGLFDCVGFPWAELDPTVTSHFEIFEIFERYEQVGPDKLKPIRFPRRRFLFRFGNRGGTLCSTDRRIDLLCEDGRPSAQAVALVRDWAEAAVEFGEGILQPDRPQFVKLIQGASPRAVAARECLLRAFPRGLTAEELVAKMRERGSPCSAQVLSQRVIPELRRLGAEIENRRGAGYYLVPLARAK